ncbi:MAG: filamentous hemagglutinin N-terminal domain-containing protein [Alphaproteobacteria bacterium]|nr:filamentous hemagglutinin N-terminal domain-containing protein [Alphaproteobacteria bacterium]
MHACQKMKFSRNAPAARIVGPLAIFTAALLSTSVLIPGALANPEGGVVSGGSVLITGTGKKLDVYQHTDRAVIDWRSFDIEVDEHTEFHQPSSGATTLNRVNSADPSRILGRLTANGNVVLVNPSGVFFGKDAVVDVSGLVATSADIGTEAFMAGSDHFDIPGEPDAEIINEGTITARDAGLVGLVAPGVENRGVIAAKLGRVQLSSGDTVVADFYGDGLLKVEVTDEKVRKQFVGNTGKLEAEGGTVAMSAAAAREVIDSLIVVEGELKAPAVERRGGKITIGAAGSNKTGKAGASSVIVRASLDASGRDEGEQGGSIEVLGDHIALLDGTVLDASGHSAPVPQQKSDGGTATMTADRQIRSEEEFLAHENRAGGSIKIGGDYLGKGDTQTAKTLYVGDFVLAMNDAVQSGDAGRTIFWSDDTTEFNGLVLARGGLDGGNGGFLETSGKENLLATGFADLSARYVPSPTWGEDQGEESMNPYSKGTYLLDPASITIYGNVDPTFVSTDASINLDANLRLWLDASDIDGDGVSEGTGESGLVSGAVNCGADLTCVSVWADKSGNSRDATQGTADRRPTFTTGGLNGLDVISFNSDYLTTGSPGIGGFEDIAAFAGVSVSSYTNGGGTDGSGSYIWDRSPAGSPLFDIKIVNDRYAIQRRYDNGSGLTGIGSTTTVSSSPTLVSIFRDVGSAMSIHINGVEENSAADVNTSLVPNALRIGAHFGGGGNTQATMMDIIYFKGPVSHEETNIIHQYQSAKWGIALTSPGTGANEAAKAMASDGYGVFTTRYLERLSESADIVLAATNSVTLDLQGDTLALDTDRNISLTTTNGDITDVSAGTIRTSRTNTGGNINLAAGGGGRIHLDTTNLESINGGVVNLSAGGDVNLSQTSALNMGLVRSDGNVSISVSGPGNDIVGTGGIVTEGGTIDVTSGRDLDFGAAGLRSSGGPITLGGGNDVFLNTALNAGAGAVSVTAGRDVFLSSADLTGELVARWSFDEGIGGSAGDSGGNGHDGTLLGNTAWSTDTPFGTGFSLSFDGNGDSVNAGDISDIELGPVTVSFWAKTNNLNQDYGFFYKGTHTTGQPILIWKDDVVGSGAQAGNTDTLSLLVYDGVTQDWISAPSNSLNDTGWNFIAVTLDPDNNVMNMFLNGVSPFGNGYLMNSNGIRNTANATTFGEPLNSQNDLNGFMDEVRIYGAALSSDNIARLFTYSPRWNSGSTVLNAGRDVTLNGSLTATDSGNAIILAAGRNFVNTAGAGALDASDANGRWLVYSSDPAANMLNGLGADFKRYNKTFAGYEPGSVIETGNGLLYSIAPQLSVKAQDATREYGEPNPLFGYQVEDGGLIDGDALADAGITGVPVLTSTAGQSSDAGSYLIDVTPGTLASELGYRFVFYPGTLSVTKAPLAVALQESAPERMEGDANPALVLVYTGFRLADNASVLDSLPTASTLAGMPSSPGRYSISVAGGEDNNYDLNWPDPVGYLTVKARPAPPSVGTQLPSTWEHVAYANDGLGFVAQTFALVSSLLSPVRSQFVRPGEAGESRNNGSGGEVPGPEKASGQAVGIVGVPALRVRIEPDLAREFGLSNRNIGELFR